MLPSITHRRQNNSQDNDEYQHLLKQEGSLASTTAKNKCGITKESYMEIVRPSYGSMCRILVHNHFLVGRRRWRLLFAFGMQSFHVFCNWFLWHILEQVLPVESREFYMFIIFRNITPALFVLSLKSMMDTLLAEMVSAKESKMKAVQMVYGVPPWVYWCSYCFYHLMICIPVSAFWTVSLYYSSFQGCNQFLVFTMFQLGYAHAFSWSLLLSTLVDKLEQISSISLILLVLNLAPIALANATVTEIPRHLQMLFGFMPTTAINNWATGVILLRLNGYEWTWDEDFFKAGIDLLNLNAGSVSVQELPSPGYVFLTFLLHMPLWAVFAYWCDQVIQAEHGTAKPLTFLLQPRYMCPKRLPARVGLLSEVSATDALQIHHLTKTFSRGGCCKRQAALHNALDDMNLVVHCREIFAVLGHNGAGKTTAINCITGMVPSSSGTWEIMGLNGITDIERCRSNLSVCPQDNPMWKELTVTEHIAFFSAVRGTKDVQKEIVEILKALGIAAKGDCQCGQLSGGQKRRLWVATALVGKAPVVFLDEPTSGMDPNSRRELWSLLLRMKEHGRTIIFTTHYLEEADTLADRKAVLSKGKVKAAGTSNELKLKFGAGYRLKIFLNRGVAEDRCVQIKQLVVETVLGATEEQFDEVTRAHDAPLELRFTLPYDQVSVFGSLFSNIEENTETLQILDYELAMTSLEDVFMALGREDDMEAGGAGSTKSLEFQELQQDQQADEFVKLTTSEYARLLFWLRTRQLIGPKMIRTIVLPVLTLFYGLGASTQFFTHRKVLAGSFALYPGIVLGTAGMRFLQLLVQERDSKIAHVMFSQGMPQHVYWIITSCHSGLQVSFFGLIVSFMVHGYGDESFTSGMNLYFIHASALFAPFPLLLFFYWSAAFFKSEESATRYVGLVVTLTSLAQVLPVQFWSISVGNLATAAMAIHLASSFLSPIHLMGGVIIGCWRTSPLIDELTDDVKLLELTKEFAALWIPFFGQFCLSGVLCMAIYRRIGARSQQKKLVEEKPSRRDEDVLLEEERVKNTTPEAESCLFRNLHHIYESSQKSVHAVQGISLGIKQGECFGLLGPNGAGKTTTLACLTGEIHEPTCGEVFIAGHDVLTGNVSEAYEQLGNCPQVDPLFLNLSGRINLYFYGRLKGVPPHQLSQTVDLLLQRLGIDVADRDKIVSKYSGGMKRKLSLGIALIGRSNLLFLDEPTASVDVASKRLLWQVIKKRVAGRTVIITTHSMEEAEAICDRIAIQVLGQLRCIGTPLHLKGKYSSGYQVAVRLNKQVASSSAVEEQSERLLRDLSSSLSTEIQLLEVYDGSFLFQLPRFEKGALTLAKVFARLQETKQKFGIEEYTLTHASLEQVFLRFAREQAEGTEKDSS